MADDSVVLDPASTETAIASTKSGLFVVRATGADPYLDGYRLHLTIGNAMAAGYSQFALHITYGPTKPSFTPHKPANLNKLREHKDDLKSWESRLRTSKQTLHKALLPGVDTAVDVVLPGVHAEDIRYLKIRIEPETFTFLSQEQSP
jgi:hypothetical protein